MKLPEGSKVTVTYGECQGQAKLNCGANDIAMAVLFALEKDPSTARFSDELLRVHLRTCFADQELAAFPLPKAKYSMNIVQNLEKITFKVSRLWRRLLPVSPVAP